MNLVRASVLILEHVDILRDSVRHPSKNLLSFEFSTCFRFQFGASRYVTGLNRTSLYKVSVVRIFYELPFSISSISIYYGTQSDIRVKSYCRLNLIRTSILNFECLDILRESIGRPSKKLLSFEFATSFRFQYGASRYITGLNRTSVYKVIVISICSELLVSILSVSIYFLIQSDIRVKSYCRLNWLRA